MAGIAAISNPLGNRDVLLWYATTAKQLAVEHRSLDSGEYFPYRDNGVVPGAIRLNTRLASVIHNRAVTVYGITSYTDPKGNTLYTVSSLSPIYNPIDITAGGQANPGAYNAIAAAGDDREYDYVYFLQDQNNVSQKPAIVEYQFNLNSPGSRFVYTELFPDPTSNLASCLDKNSGTRMIVYQVFGRTTLYFAWSDKKTGNPISGTNNATKGTPLAVAIVPFEDKSMEVYLYYVDNENQLYRVVYSGTKAGGSWGAISHVGQAGEVHSSSGLTVIPDPPRDANHVYLTTNGTNYIDYVDRFRSRVVLL